MFDICMLLIVCVYNVLVSSCFLTRASHKFRSEFGKSRLVRDKEKMLVAFSGGRASSAMVHLIEQVTYNILLMFSFLQSSVSFCSAV